MYEDLKPICNALDCAAPTELNDQAKRLYQALTGREEEFNIGKSTGALIGKLYANGSKTFSIQPLMTKRCISNAASITAVKHDTIAKLLHGMEYFNFDANGEGGLRDPATAISGLWFHSLLPWVPGGTIDMTTTEDQYPDKWLATFIDLDNLCARLFWIKINLNELPTFTSNKEVVEYLNSCRSDEYTLGDPLDYVNFSYVTGVSYQLGSSSGAIPSGATASYYSDKLFELTIAINSKVLGTAAGNVYYPRLNPSGGASGSTQWTYWDIEAGTTFSILLENKPTYTDSVFRAYVQGWKLQTIN